MAGVIHVPLNGDGTENESLNAQEASYEKDHMHNIDDFPYSLTDTDVKDYVKNSEETIHDYYFPFMLDSKRAKPWGSNDRKQWSSNLRSHVGTHPVVTPCPQELQKHVSYNFIFLEDL